MIIDYELIFIFFIKYIIKCIKMYKKNLMTQYFSNDDISSVHPDIFFILNIY